MWGTGASSTQCEGASPDSDWYQWERAGHAPISGDGNNFAIEYARDFERLSSIGLDHHRLSIEWARIEPSMGIHDQEAIAHYRRVLSAAREHSITPWVCLHHFTLPQWVANLGGFLVPETRQKYWSRHVDFMAETFGDLVGGWQPVNETNYYPTAAYLGRGWSPGHNDIVEWRTVTREMHLATAEAAVRLRETGLPVSSVYGLSTVEPLDSSEATANFVNFFYAVNWDAGIALHRDGILRIPGMEDIIRPDLRGCFDMIGFSYYCVFGVRDGALTVYPTASPQSPLGYSIWPEGLRAVLDRLRAEIPDTPILIAEYGLGTDNDDERVQYLRRGLAITHEAIARGLDIRGFFHWTAVDNYEWLHGYDLKFGLLDKDRAIKPSADVLRR
jgi:beta-glucosidase